MAVVSLVQRDVSPSLRLRRWRFGERSVGGVSAHAGIEIAWCQRGAAEYVVGRERLMLVPGRAIVLPMEIEHATNPEGGTDAASLLLDPRALEEAAEALGMSVQSAHLSGGSDDRPASIALLGSLIERETELALPGRAMAVEGLVNALVVEVLRANGVGPMPEVRRDPRVKRAIDLIHARYADPLTIEEMARTAHISRYHFARVFRLETGKTPYRYLLDVRIAEAARLLREGRYAIGEAALTAGWNDLGRFGRLFRETHGMTPSEYVRANAPRAG